MPSRAASHNEPSRISWGTCVRGGVSRTVVTRERVSAAASRDSSTVSCASKTRTSMVGNRSDNLAAQAIDGRSVAAPVATSTLERSA